MPGNEANGVVRHHEPSAAAASVRLDGSVWPMTEPFIRHSSTSSHGVFILPEIDKNVFRRVRDVRRVDRSDFITFPLDAGQHVDNAGNPINPLPRL